MDSQCNFRLSQAQQTEDFGQKYTSGRTRAGFSSIQTLFRQAFFLTDIKSGVKKFRKIQARSSGGERYLDTVEVVGSNPIVPTIKNHGVTVNTVTFIKSQFVSIHKWSFCPISALCEKNNPRNINYMPTVIFFACLDLEQKSSFMDGHQLLRSPPIYFANNFFLLS